MSDRRHIRSIAGLSAATPLACHADSASGGLVTLTVMAPGLLILFALAIVAFIGLRLVDKRRHTDKPRTPISQQLIAADRWPAYVSGPTRLADRPAEHARVVAVVTLDDDDEIRVCLTGATATRFLSAFSEGQAYAFTLAGHDELDGRLTFTVSEYQHAHRPPG